MYEFMAGVMLEHEKNGHLLKFGVVWCEKHRACCRGGSWAAAHGDGEAGLGDDDSTIKAVVVGSTCKVWSSRGAQRRHGGKSMLPFLVWIFLLRHIRPDIVVHECTMNFDVSLLQRWLSHLYQMVSLVVSPEPFGVPAARNRRYTMMANKCSMTFVGPRHFEHVFAMACEVDADVFFSAGEAEILLPPSTGRTCTRRRCSSACEYASNLGAHQAPSGCFVCKLQQGYGFETCGPVVLPCLLASSSPVICSFRHQRHMVASEMFAVQGFDVSGLSGKYKSPWSKVLNSPAITMNQRKELVGNAMYMQGVTVCLLYTVANTKRFPLHIHGISMAQHMVECEDEVEIVDGTGSGM